MKLALRPENPKSGQRFRASGELEGDRESPYVQASGFRHL